MKDSEKKLKSEEEKKQEEVRERKSRGITGRQGSVRKKRAKGDV